jgi:hypothetical protein
MNMQIPEQNARKAHHPKEDGKRRGKRPARACADAEGAEQLVEISTRQAGDATYRGLATALVHTAQIVKESVCVHPYGVISAHAPILNRPA